MKIVVGSDHGGFEYKNAIKDYLISKGYEIIDVGTNSKESCDYPIFAKDAAKKVASGEATFGILVCTSGEGISMAANKVNGIRCGIAYSDEVTVKMREHNDANMVAFGQSYMALSDVIKRVMLFIETPFSNGERHIRRVKEIEEN